MNEYQINLLASLDGLTHITKQAVLSHSGTLEGLERNGNPIPTLEDYKGLELQALAENAPITLKINELMEEFKSTARLTDNALLERIAKAVEPDQEAISKASYEREYDRLKQAYENADSIREATDIFNELSDLETNGVRPVMEVPKKIVPTVGEISAMGVSQVSELLTEFPDAESQRIILDAIQDC